MAAAVLGRTQLQIKKTGTAVAVPNDPLAKLMYYFDCICTCVEAGNDNNTRRLRDYKNYFNISIQEEAQLVALCITLSPDKLVGTIFFLAEDSALNGFSNDFFELSQVNTRMVITESLLIGGQQKRIRKIMMFKKSWIENNYLNPLRAMERRERRPPAPVTQQPYTRPGGQYTQKVQQPYSNDAGGLVFGVCTFFCLAILGCWWALPCSIIAVVLGIASSSNNSGNTSSASTQRTCSVLCSVCSWVTAAIGLVAIIVGFLFLTRT